MLQLNMHTFLCHFTLFFYKYFCHAGLKKLSTFHNYLVSVLLSSEPIITKMSNHHCGLFAHLFVCRLTSPCKSIMTDLIFCIFMNIHMYIVNESEEIIHIFCIIGFQLERNDDEDRSAAELSKVDVLAVTFIIL